MSDKNNQNLKLGWRIVKFGDVVTQVKDRVDDAMISGHTHYVRGEDFVPAQIRLGSRSKLGDGQHGPAFHMQFKAGDVLYVSRNPRLRKAAVPNFDGICANTTYVCRSDTSILVQELLPFIMQTEGFSEYTKRHQRGSTNFYVNWSDIAPYEFMLPPMDEQHRLVKFLASIEDCLASLSEADLVTTALENSRIEDALALVPADRVFTVEELAPLGPKNGLSPKVNADGSGYPTLSISAVRDGRIVTEGNTKYAEISDAEAAVFELKANDVLVVRGNGNKLLTGKCGIVDVVPKGCFYPDLLIRLRFDEKIIRPEFAVLQWNSQSTHNHLISRAKSTNGVWKINGADIRKHTLKVPEVEAQDALLAEMRAIRLARKTIAARKAAAQNLRSQALKSIENGGEIGI
jgi:type I restriction enzyme S subunit